MNLAAVSAAALAAAILLSCLTRLNIGVIAVCLAWIVGVHVGGMSVREVAAGFPAELFLTLAGVTLLFTEAEQNGTLSRVAARAVRLCRGRAGWLPVLFFVLASALASLGPGNIATAALLAPPAMAAALRARIPPFLMAIMVGNGANSGSLSPIAPTGVIVNGLMARQGLQGHELANWLNNLGAHAAVAFAGYVAFGGLRLFGLGRVEAAEEQAPPFERRHQITLVVLGALLAAVLFLRAPIGMAAFCGAGALAVLRVVDEGEAIRRMPWATLVMVSGVTVLIGIVEKTQGIELFAGLIAQISSKDTVTAVAAFVTGVVSAYSSTSGVVLPAFLPMAPHLAERLGAGALAIASSMNVGGHLVDVSPLSTIGALCVAAVPAAEESRRLFNQLMAWGLSMAGVGALLCWMLFS